MKMAWDIDIWTREKKQDIVRLWIAMMHGIGKYLRICLWILFMASFGVMFGQKCFAAITSGENSEEYTIPDNNTIGTQSCA